MEFFGAATTAVTAAVRSISKGGKTMISENHAAWLEARGLDVELAAKYGLESRGNHLAFPYTRKGKVVS
jgi:hypothetical protein